MEKECYCNKPEIKGIIILPEVFFDTPYKHKDGKKWCHLGAMNEDRLHEFAERIGLKKEWFQKSNDGLPHYDIYSERIRQIALQEGAVKVTRKDFLQLLKFHYGTEQ